MAGRKELQVVDGSTTYDFVIAPGEKGGKLYSLQTKDWEPSDPILPWRVALHPWKAGLANSRRMPHITISGDLRNRPSMTYAKANGDGSYGDKFVPPPKLNSIAPALVVTPLTSYKDLAYGSSFYGEVVYLGAPAEATPLFLNVRNFNNKGYFAGGRYLYSIDSSYTLAQVKDFGAGMTIYAIVPFNDELIIAMGESEKIWKMTAAESFTQASDSTYAIALGAVDDKLWRAESINKISNCITDPLTLTSWVPASPNQYSAGNTNYSVTDIVDYGGVPWVIKPDGVYSPDAEAKYHNQIPQLAIYPHVDNGKGSFTAMGYLWVPSVSGLLRVQLGEAIPFGPETSNRPDYRFWTRGGVEWGGDLYLLVTDEGGTSDTFICKVSKDIEGLTNNPSNMIYHELVRLGPSKGYFITLTTAPTNPTIIAGYGTELRYFLLGRGGGADIDDALYEFGTSWELETGEIVPNQDLGVEAGLVGVKVVLYQPANSTLAVSYDLDKAGSYTSLLTTAEGGGVATITATGLVVDTLYAQPGVKGNLLKFKVNGTLPAGIKGSARPEVLEAWAFGEAHPNTLDIITLGLYASRGALVRGLRHGMSAGEISRQWRYWADRGTVLDIRIPDYEETHPTRFVVADVKEQNIAVMGEGNKEVLESVVTIALKRIDYAGGYASA